MEWGSHEHDRHDVARVLLLGATAAGIFGTITLKSWPTALQGLIGLVGWFSFRSESLAVRAV